MSQKALNERAALIDELDSNVAAGFAVGQTWVLAEAMRLGDVVLVPTGEGSYAAAVIAGPYRYVPGADLPHQRPVDWLAIELDRDQLSEKLRNTLGFGGTVQSLNPHAEELRTLLNGLGQ